MPSPPEKAALLSRSLRALQERHGERFGEGPKVEIFHALEDLRLLADALATELAAGPRYLTAREYHP